MTSLIHRCGRPHDILIALTWCAAPLIAHDAASAGPADPPVQVIVDMDAQTPGIQSTIQVDSCTTSVQGIAVYVRDPIQARSFFSIGYIGAIDRGISFGHMRTNTNGMVASMTAQTGTPVHPDNVAYISQGVFQTFTGPELVYLELGSRSPAVIAAIPAAPIFTVDVVLSNPHPGDTFRFYLLDYVSVWTFNAHGAFSTQQPINSLDSGGDAVPDGTQTTQGVDPDISIPVPPAAFLVDYIDGPISGGGAVIEIIPRTGDVNADSTVNIDDLLAVINAWGPCTPNCPADLDHNGVVNIDDLLLVIANWC